MSSVEEIEKNLNYIWDKTHNMFKIKVDNKSYEEVFIDFKLKKRRGDLVEACDIAEKFMQGHLMALRDDANLKLVMKEMFNTLKLIIK